jgi:hypothetical protein
MILQPKREYSDLPTLNVELADEPDEDGEPLYEIRPAGARDGNRARWSLRTLREWWDYQKRGDENG